MATVGAQRAVDIPSAVSWEGGTAGKAGQRASGSESQSWSAVLPASLARNLRLQGAQREAARLCLLCISTLSILTKLESAQILSWAVKGRWPCLLVFSSACFRGLSSVSSYLADYS